MRIRITPRILVNVRRAVLGVGLGGYVILARSLDKGRAEIAGTAGEYKYNNPMDHHWFRFTGITPEAMRGGLATGRGDGEMLAWIEQTSPHKRTPLGNPSMERLAQ
jgi:hypothetical protein